HRSGLAWFARPSGPSAPTTDPQCHSSHTGPRAPGRHEWTSSESCRSAKYGQRPLGPVQHGVAHRTKKKPPKPPTTTRTHHDEVRGGGLLQESHHRVGAHGQGTDRHRGLAQTQIDEILLKSLGGRLGRSGREEELRGVET